jgi:hypothetical protein
MSDPANRTAADAARAELAAAGITVTASGAARAGTRLRTVLDAWSTQRRRSALRRARAAVHADTNPGDAARNPAA